MDPLVIVFGLGVGVLVGLTGIGGGSLMTPLLLLVIGTQPVVAIGTDIAYGALTKTVGGWRHLRNRTVDLGTATWLAFGSVPGSIAGVVLVESLPSPPDNAALGGRRRAHVHVAADARTRAVPAEGPRARARRRAAHAAQQGDGGPPRHRARLRAGRDVGRQRRAHRARADPVLPPDAAPGRRHGRLPRGRAAVGGRRRACDRRQRRLRADEQHPCRLGAGCGAGRAAVAQRSRGRAAAGARRGDARIGARRRLEGRARPAGVRDRRPAAARARARLPAGPRPQRRRIAGA